VRRGCQGQTALGNIPSHLKGAVNHSLFIKSSARPGEKCQEHKSTPLLSCKGPGLPGTAPSTVPRQGTARPRSLHPSLWTRDWDAGQGPVTGALENPASLRKPSRWEVVRNKSGVHLRAHGVFLDPDLCLPLCPRAAGGAGQHPASWVRGCRGGAGSDPASRVR